MFESFAVRDGNLITGQQQNSGAKAAELVLKALEDDKKISHLCIGTWSLGR